MATESQKFSADERVEMLEHFNQVGAASGGHGGAHPPLLAESATQRLFCRIGADLIFFALTTVLLPS